MFIILKKTSRPVCSGHNFSLEVVSWTTGVVTVAWDTKNNRYKLSCNNDSTCRKCCRGNTPRNCRNFLLVRVQENLITSSSASGWRFSACRLTSQQRGVWTFMLDPSKALPDNPPHAWTGEGNAEAGEPVAKAWWLLWRQLDNVSAFKNRTCLFYSLSVPQCVCNIIFFIKCSQ